MELRLVYDQPARPEPDVPGSHVPGSGVSGVGVGSGVDQFFLRFDQWWRQESRRLGRSERDVMTAVKAFADGRGVAWPGIAKLMEVTGLGRRTVITARKSLINDGYLRELTRGGGSGRAKRVQITLKMTAQTTEESETTPRLTLVDGEISQETDAKKGATGCTVSGKKGANPNKKGCKSLHPKTPIEDTHTPPLTPPTPEATPTPTPTPTPEPSTKSNPESWATLIAAWEQGEASPLFAETEAAGRARRVVRWLADRGVSEAQARSWVRTHGVGRCVRGLAEWDHRRSRIKFSYANALGHWLEHGFEPSEQVQQAIQREKQARQRQSKAKPTPRDEHNVTQLPFLRRAVVTAALARLSPAERADYEQRARAELPLVRLDNGRFYDLRPAAGLSGSAPPVCEAMYVLIERDRSATLFTGREVSDG